MRPTLARLERILAMVPWLLAHPGAPIAEVAERFGATPAEIAADLDVLGFCGVPGYGGGDLVEVSVVGDRVQVRMADFFRRPLRLELREVVTLLLAGKALLEVPQFGDQDALNRAVARLEAALGGAQVAIELSTPDAAMLDRLREAITRGRVVRLSYRSSGAEEESVRLVEPWALIAAEGSWYLRGHCRQAEDVRDFRLDRVREATVTQQAAPPAPDDRSSEAPAYSPRADDLDVLLEIDDVAAWVIDAVPGAHEPEAGKVRLRARSLEWAARLALSLGDHVRVIEPAQLRDRVRELATATRARYRDDENAGS